MGGGNGQGLLDNRNEANPQPKRNVERGNQDLWFLYLLFKGAAFGWYVLFEIGSLY